MFEAEYPKPRQLSPTDRIVHAVGSIVLCSQNLERLLKFLTPFRNSDEPELGAIIKRHAKLDKTTLGPVMSEFFGSTSGEEDDLSAYIKRIVDGRNDIVHNFGSRFGPLMAQGRYEEVISELRVHHEYTVGLARQLRELALLILETMRDTTFHGTEEQEDIARICESLRSLTTGQHKA